MHDVMRKKFLTLQKQNKLERDELIDMNEVLVRYRRALSVLFFSKDASVEKDRDRVRSGNKTPARANRRVKNRSRNWLDTRLLCFLLL